MDWQNYETTVKDIYETLGKNFGVVIEGYGNKCRRVGKSGVEHQIDVLTSHSDGVHKYFTAIECKYWKEKINKDVIMKMNEIVSDCDFNKGVVVSKIGFTPDAVKYAIQCNVALVELHENNVHDSIEKITKIFVNYEITKAVLDKVNCVVATAELNKYKNNPPNGRYSDYYIQEKDGSVINVREIVRDFLNTKVLEASLLEFVQERIKFPPKSLLKSRVDNYSFAINGIDCKGYIISYTQLDFDYIQDKVFMIMKNIFEKKSYAVTNDGQVYLLIKPPITAVVGEQIKFKLNLTKRTKIK